MWKILFLLASPLWAQSPGPSERAFTFPEFRECGLVTRYSSNKISPACLQAANNLLYDEDFSLLRRNGYSQYNMTPCQDSATVRGLWKFDAVDGTHYMVIFSSGSFFQTSGEGSCTPITGWSGFSTTAEMECVQTIGALWCANGVDFLSYWNGTSTASVANAPIFPHIGAFRNRVWGGDVSGTRTRLRGSGELDGTDWALQIPGRSTTPVSIDIAGTNDGNPVNCLMGEYQGAFYIGRPDDLHALYGYDRRDFTLRKISKEIGCTEPKSVQEKNNALYWLSKRGVERLTGTTIERVSDPIRPLIDTIIQSAGNSLTKTFSSQAEFQGGNAQFCTAGTFQCTSAIISPGNVVVSTWGVVDDTATEFSNGLTNNTSTISTSGSVVVYNSSVTTFFNAGGEYDQAYPYTNWGNDNAIWTPSNFTLSLPFNLTSPKFGTYYWAPSVPFPAGSCPLTMTFEILDTNNNVVKSTAITINDSGNNDNIWYMYNINTSTLPYAQLKLRVTEPITSLAPTMTSVPFVRASSVTVWVSDGNPAVDVCTGIFDWDESISQTVAGSYSNCHDTGLTAPIFGAFEVATSSDANSTLAYQSQTAASCSGTFSALSTLTPGSKVTSTSNRAIKYTANFTLNSSTNTPASFTSASLFARTTAYYISDCANPGSTITEWGNFLVNNIPDNGSFTFWTSTGSTCGQASAANANWVPQVPNSAISNATSAFISARTLFTIDSGTQNPTINDFTFEWDAGAARPPVASAVYRDRYWLFFSSSTDPGKHNDHAVVADAEDKWSLMDNINAYSATVYNRNLYTGDSLASGLIYQQDVGQDDNGASFTMSFRSADIAMDNPAQLKVLKTVYVYLQPPTISAQSIAPTFTYQIDGSTVSYALGSPNLSESVEGTGYFVAKLPVPAGQPSTFHWFNLGMIYAGDVGPLRVYGIQVIYEGLDWQ